MNRIYFDYQATTPMDKRVLDAMMPTLTTEFGNAGSKSHSFGWDAENLVEKARQQVANVINADKLTVVDFYATWCGPCRKLGPILEEVEGEIGDRVNFAKIDTDDNIDAAKEYQVSGLPTLLVFKNGEVVERMVGLMPKSSIITNIEKHL